MTRDEFIIKEVLRYVQIPYEKADQGLKEQILGYYEQVGDRANPRWCYKVVPIVKERDRIHFEGTNMTSESRDLKRLFKSSDQCYFMAATLGVEVDKLIRLTQNKHMGDALFLDACANVMIEEVCDKAEQEIMATLPENRYMTMRYSPGYGDVPIEVQKTFINILNAQKMMGLIVSKSGMLLPLKSITAFIGISSEKEQRIKSCKNCMMQANCVYRKRGDVCGC